jgi:hypothetical protein
MRQMPAVRERHAEDRIAGLQHGEVHGLVRLRARMRLHVRVFRLEQLLHAIERERLGNVDEFAAAVIALAGIAFGVLVRQLRALCFHHRVADVILRRDQLDVIFLPEILCGNRLPEMRIAAGDGIGTGEHGVGGGGSILAFRVLASSPRCWHCLPGARHLTRGEKPYNAQGI